MIEQNLPAKIRLFADMAKYISYFFLHILYMGGSFTWIERQKCLSLRRKVVIITDSSMEWLKISTSTELVRVQPQDIVFVCADGNYSDMYLFDGKPYKMTFQLHYFDDVFKKLKDNTFVRVGKSLIVNKNYIHIINLTNQELRLNGQNLRSEFRLKASKEALKELKALIEQEGEKA